jgi:hypothetical protein
MSRESRRLAGILLVIFPTALFGGVTLLRMLTSDASYTDNELRQDLWRAGHAHAGILLVLSLVMLRYVDDAVLPSGWRWFAGHGAPIAAILMPAGFFFSMPTAATLSPSPLIYLVYAGGIILAASLITLGVGLLRAHHD